MVRLLAAATVSSDQTGIPPLEAAEVGGDQPQLAPPRFLPLPFFFPLERPGVRENDCEDP